MNWYAQTRHDWIKEMLRIYGFINRSHVVEKFGCSPQSAGHDLTRVYSENEDWVEYCPRRRAYINKRKPENA